MAHFEDLTPCDYFTLDHQNQLLAVGWLDPSSDYARGIVSEDVIARLHELLVNPWEPAVSMGCHDCGFCRVTSGPRRITIDNVTAHCGVTNLFIPSNDVLYVAPSLILHYIDAHEYAPPPPFCDAVLACPEMRSMAYLKRIRTMAPAGLFGGGDVSLG